MMQFAKDLSCRLTLRSLKRLTNNSHFPRKITRRDWGRSMQNLAWPNDKNVEPIFSTEVQHNSLITTQLRLHFFQTDANTPHRCASGKPRSLNKPRFIGRSRARNLLFEGRDLFLTRVV